MQAIGATALERVCRLPVELVANYTQSAKVNTCVEVVSVVTQLNVSNFDTRVDAGTDLGRALCSKSSKGMGEGPAFGVAFHQQQWCGGSGFDMPITGHKVGLAGPNAHVVSSTRQWRASSARPRSWWQWPRGSVENAVALHGEEVALDIAMSARSTVGGKVWPQVSDQMQSLPTPMSLAATVQVHLCGDVGRGAAVRALAADMGSSEGVEGTTCAMGRGRLEATAGVGAFDGCRGAVGRQRLEVMVERGRLTAAEVQWDVNAWRRQLEWVRLTAAEVQWDVNAWRRQLKWARVTAAEVQWDVNAWR